MPLDSGVSSLGWLRIQWGSAGRTCDIAQARVVIQCRTRLVNVGLIWAHGVFSIRGEWEVMWAIVSLNTWGNFHNNRGFSNILKNRELTCVTNYLPPHAVCHLSFQLKCKVEMPRGHFLLRTTRPKERPKKICCCFIAKNHKNQTSHGNVIMSFE